MDESLDLATLIRDVVNILEGEGILDVPQMTPVVMFKDPDKLRDTVLDIPLGKEGSSRQDVLEVCRHVVRYSVKTGSPFFLNQLYHGLDPFGLVAALITECLNTNQYTFEVAPVFTLCEMEVIQNLLKLVGMENGDGIFSPGGSISNMYGIISARYKKFPETKKKGVSHLPELVIFTSQDGHYSMTKSAHWLGIGTENVVEVEADSNGRMIPEKLAEHIERVKGENKCPLFVNATLGTTVLGAFDPLDEIAEICRKHDIWFHVDACWGGSFMFSNTYVSLTSGLKRANSMSWNPHKMLGAPLQCSVFLISEKGLLHECNSARAGYLFQTDKYYDPSYDTGDKSIQCGRKCDAFKFWLMWRARGISGFGELVDQAMHSARYLTGRLSGVPGFKLVVHEFDCTNVAFWYIPPRLRGLPETNEWWEEVDKVAPKLKSRLVHVGAMMITFQRLPQRGLKNFFRVAITCHPVSTTEQMDDIITQIETHGADL